MSKYTSGKWEAHPNRIIANGHVVAIVNGGNAANERLIAAAPEMYRMLREFLKIDEQKVRAATEKNDPAYMIALMEQDGAVNMAKELLGRIDGTEAGQ